MAKAILVLDKMPMDCEDCNLSYRNAYAGVTCPALVKPVGDTWVSVANGERFALCPLKELPEPEINSSITDDDWECLPDDYEVSTAYAVGHQNGFNDCLKEITED